MLAAGVLFFLKLHPDRPVVVAISKKTASGLEPSTV
jgi:hypothetical protein